jgi:hypothetical protein
MSRRPSTRRTTAQEEKPAIVKRETRAATRGDSRRSVRGTDSGSDIAIVLSQTSDLPVLVENVEPRRIAAKRRRARSENSSVADVKLQPRKRSRRTTAAAAVKAPAAPVEPRVRRQVKRAAQHDDDDDGGDGAVPDGGEATKKQPRRAAKPTAIVEKRKSATAAAAPRRGARALSRGLGSKSPSTRNVRANGAAAKPKPSSRADVDDGVNGTEPVVLKASGKVSAAAPVVSLLPKATTSGTPAQASPKLQQPPQPQPQQHQETRTLPPPVQQQQQHTAATTTTTMTPAAMALSPQAPVSLAARAAASPRVPPPSRTAQAPDAVRATSQTFDVLSPLFVDRQLRQQREREQSLRTRHYQAQLISPSSAAAGFNDDVLRDDTLDSDPFHFARRRVIDVSAFQDDDYSASVLEQDEDEDDDDAAAAAAAAASSSGVLAIDVGTRWWLWLCLQDDDDAAAAAAASSSSGVLAIDVGTRWWLWLCLLTLFPVSWNTSEL